nr:MAG TPA: hypothetical protein [Caudoviricetes sp.]
MNYIFYALFHNCNCQLKDLYFIRILCYISIFIPIFLFLLLFHLFFFFIYFLYYFS